jgi:CsoR family transcriptional regulator, copper-sensing transcriptional repressor
MMEAGTSWPGVLVPVSPVTRVLQEVAVGLLTDHLCHCVMGAIRSSEAGGNASFDEVARVIRHVVRL